ncbi:MAG: TonB-dependent receptor [Bacteroidetes bacterium]|nr:TonB-dependent receptor [Bacteroidota bacterium]
MKKMLLGAAFACQSAISFAQTSGTISGKITDGGNQQIIDAATVFLLQSKDSSLVKTSVTDKDGNFVFELVPFGTYIVEASSIGHSKVYSQTINLQTNNTAFNTGLLKLAPAGKEMAAVVVHSKKQFIERKIDKTVVNPDALISNTGTSAMEALEKAPGISIDKDDNISLKGKQGVIIMIDGKPSYLSGADLANFLRNLPSSNLEQIEIMTNPPAKFDASGNSGVINIKTKKNKQKGLNGSANLAYGQGFYPKTNNSFNLNYRNGKFNLYSTVSANYRKNDRHLDISRIYLNEDNSVKAIFSQNTTDKRENYNFNAKLGMDYYASKKTTFGIVLTGYTTPRVQKGNSFSYPRSSAGILDSIVTATNSEDSKWKNAAINLNFIHNFDSTGRQITADVDFLQYSSDKDQQFDNVIYNADFTQRYSDRLLGELPATLKIYSVKTDYTQTIAKKIKMDAGLKFSYVTTNNTADYYNVIDDLKTIDIRKTNRFTYDENINAAYLNFSREIKKWGFQLGVRVENTHYKGHQYGNIFRPEMDSSFTKSYTNAFPTAYVSYTANDKNQFGFSYGRRIERPDYEDLNPFLYFLDKYTYGEGNPFLKPMYSNVFELTHTYNQFLNTTLNYNRTKDLFSETFRQNNEPGDSISSILSKGNFGIAHNISLSENAQVKITKWWNLILYAEVNYQEFHGQVSGESVDLHRMIFTGNINNQFSFKKGWGAEISGFYRSQSLEGQIQLNGMSQMDIAIKKDILKNKGSLRVALRDVYGPRVNTGNINFQQTRASFSQYNDNRVITIGFNYRFGKPLKSMQKRKTGGAGDEQNRVKGI